MRGLVRVGALGRLLRGRRPILRIGRGSQRQSVLRNDVELHDKTAGVNVIGVHAKARDGPGRVDDVGD